MMYLIEKLATAIRGGTREVLESAVDANALRILAQEIYECESRLRESKQHLTQVMADKLRLQRVLEANRLRIVDKEQAIRIKLQHGDDAAAMRLADELAQLESTLTQQQQQHEQLQDYEQRVLQALKNTGYKLEQYRAELRMAQATRHAQQAVGQLSRHSHCQADGFARMQDSLERVKSQQQYCADRLQAAEQIDAYLSGEPSAQEQRQHQAASILARLRTAG